ncbi:DNA mismatch endonuclease Vsr [uncultured Roseobacter sp.]|uniref:very short patch repair endonuclease n=1 Tax=uncultured Roseobacter sp. TaxID=114847 RepID=UPI003456A1D8
MMSANRRRDTKPEMIVRRDLHRHGFRFRLDVRKLPGSPDVVLARFRAAVFVHGCYWHRHPGCRFAATPKTRVAFWEEKFARNVERDRAAVVSLKELGWRVAIVWECALREGSREANLLTLRRWIRGSSVSVAIGSKSNR